MEQNHAKYDISCLTDIMLTFCSFHGCAIGWGGGGERHGMYYFSLEKINFGVYFLALSTFLDLNFALR